MRLNISLLGELSEYGNGFFFLAELEKAPAKRHSANRFPVTERFPAVIVLQYLAQQLLRLHVLFLFEEDLALNGHCDGVRLPGDEHLKLRLWRFEYAATTVQITLYHVPDHC